MQPTILQITKTLNRIYSDNRRFRFETSLRLRLSFWLHNLQSCTPCWIDSVDYRIVLRPIATNRTYSCNRFTQVRGVLFLPFKRKTWSHLKHRVPQTLRAISHLKGDKNEDNPGIILDVIKGNWIEWLARVMSVRDRLAKFAEGNFLCSLNTRRLACLMAEARGGNQRTRLDSLSHWALTVCELQIGAL